MAQTEFSTDTLAAYFEHSSDARKALDALQRAGFESAHLGIAHRASYTGTSTTFGNTTVLETEDEPSTWDKIKAWFSGNEAETHANERTEGDLASREVTSNPAEQFDDGYDDASDLQGSFTTMNIPDDRARYFAHRFGRGKDSAVVTVQAGDRTDEAESILAQYNADFGESAATYDYTLQDDGYTEDDLLEGQNAAPRNVQLLGVMRIQTVRVVPDPQSFGRKEPARDLSGDIDRKDIDVDSDTKRERSA